MFKTPVLFLVFNRPDETRLVFEAIRKAAPRYFYIAADGPRLHEAGEKERCEIVQQIVLDINWECEVKTLIRDKNLGCKKAVSGAINWFFNEVEQGIIIEDDCLPDQSFFSYCEVLLEKFKHDERIISIGGTNLGYHVNGDHSYSFSRFMNMWGWATWRRSAQLVDYDMTAWKKMVSKNFFLHRKLQDDLFVIDLNWIRFWKNYFNRTASGDMDTWDYQWIFTQLWYKKLSVFPSQNLVQNIGFSKTATHTFDPGHPVARLALHPMPFPVKHRNIMQIDTLYEKNYIKKIWFNYRKDTLYRILRSDFLNNPAVQNVTRFFRKPK